MRPGPRYPFGPRGRIVGHIWYDPDDGEIVDLSGYYELEQYKKGPLFSRTCHGTISAAKASYVTKTTRTQQIDDYAHLYMRPAVELEGFHDVYHRFLNFYKNRLVWYGGSLQSLGEDILGLPIETEDGW